MNLYDYFKENINVKKIKSFSGDMYDMALVRYVIKEASNLFYRNYTFFLNKENLKDRDAIYNKNMDLSNMQDFSIVCKSYCDIIKKLLKKVYEIDSEEISSYSDRFRHIDLLIKTKEGNNYIVDPLTDLVEMQTGMKTNNFASKEHYENSYAKILDNVRFLTEDQLEQIDDKIGYKNDNIYLNKLLDNLKTNFNNFEEFLQKNESVAIELLGNKYDGSQLSVDEKIDLKLKYISRYLNNRKNLNGFVELVIFSDIVIKSVFSEEEQNKIKAYSFFVDKEDLQNSELATVLESSENRKRGRVINFNEKNYIFSLNQNTLEYDDEEWKKIIKENNVFVKSQYPVQLLKYIKANGADRNIVHNNEFLRLFSKFETALLNSGKTLEDIKNDNIIIQGDTILTKFGDKYVSYKIEDGNLVVRDYKNNHKHIVFFEDEGRNISHKTEPILKDSEKLHLYEFDSNGLFDLDDVSGIEDLVAPLKNGKYLSRNASYYDAKTYSELSAKRQELKDILTEDPSKKNFVILEYLANSSAKVYFEELKKKIENEDNHVLQAKKCFEEDCENIVRFFNNKPLLKPIYDLPEGKDKILDRHIEMDNKQILYLFCSNLQFKKPKHVITPGLGSIFVGPMLKSMYGFEYSNILFSLYSKDEKLRNISEQKTFDKLFSDDAWSTTLDELLLIDDNVGSCNTMNTIRNQLKEKGKSCKFGAIKYNWNFYNQVKHGELNHPTFDINQIDFLTILDDPGYWIMRDSIKALKEEGADTYVQVMKAEGLRQEDVPDILVLMQLAEKYSQNAGVDIYDMKSGNIKKSSAFLCTKLKEQIKDITKDVLYKDRCRDE